MVLFDNEVFAITAQLAHSLARKRAEIRIYSDGQMRDYWGGQDLELRQERISFYTPGVNKRDVLAEPLAGHSRWTATHHTKSQPIGS
jgi:hypothetical protein